MVELGTHSGVSYFAFCESVLRLGIRTECHAVDTWLGDQHAGYYGDEVFRGVDELNNQYYSSFSRLIRTTFDEALSQFDDSSIDLLHLDGLHTYEAVRHDFESWLPKMSKRGVVLLHDTYERKLDFGVYLLFAELKQGYPTFEFPHGHGLGIVAVGDSVPPRIAELTALKPESPEGIQVSQVYQALGARYGLEAAQEGERRQAREDLERATTQVEAQRKKLTEAAEMSERFRKEVRQVRDEERQVRDEVRQVRDEERQARKAIADLRLQLENQTQRSDDIEVQLTDAVQTHEKVLNDYRRLKRRRSVRVALAVSRAFRPLFRLRRGKRKPTNRTSTRRLEKDSTLSLPGPDFNAVDNAPSPSVWSVAITSEVPLLESEDLSHGPDPVTVIVPIHNAYDQVRRCIDSLVRNTHYRARLLLIDDASTDPRIAALLEEVDERFSNVAVLRNEANLGFVATANKGFSASVGDVILLNSDVELVPGWLRRLVMAARSNPGAATVTPLSNNAGAFSAPISGEEAFLPPSLTRDEIGRLVARHSARFYPTTPTGNGFCMFIRRRALVEVGNFDELAFPRGYGEENDFCMRALRAGWSHIVDNTTYVFHERSSSFGEERATLMANAKVTIENRYPEYVELVQESMGSVAMTQSREAVDTAFHSIEFGETIRPRLLTVIHRAGGGTPTTNLDLMRALSERYEPFQLACDTNSLILEKLTDGKLETIGTWALGQRLQPMDETRRDYRSVVSQILCDFDIEIVHIRHLLGHTFDLPSVAKVFDIPVILSFHDFYYVCPTVHLLDERQQFCGGRCTPGQGSCLIPTTWLESVPHLKHAWVYEWQDRVARMFDHVDAFVAASPSTQAIYSRVYPQIRERLHVIEHGRDVIVLDGAKATHPPTEGPVRILVPGNLGVHKGGDFLRAIKELDSSDRLEFHFAGRASESYSELGVHHGEYEHNDWSALVEGVRPSFAGLFSVTSETFSHTLSEAWLAGLPVIATDRGAFKDRIERDGGGWLVDPNDPERAYRQILEIVEDSDGFDSQVSQIPTSSLRSAAEMAADYETLYKSVQVARMPFSLVADQRPNRRPLRLGLFLLGNKGARPASTYIRVLQRYLHPSLDQVVVPIVLDPVTFVNEPDRVDIDIALVFRTAIPAELTDRFIEELRTRQVPLLLDLDDDLIGIPGEHPDYDYFATSIEPMRRIVSAANAITVSTRPLLEILSPMNPAVFLLENHLDEHLWLSPLPHREISERSSMNDGRLRILYFGSPTHGDDLEILKNGVRALGRQVHVTVVGGAATGTLDWCEHVVPESSWMQYPDFVRWLREKALAFDLAVAPLAETEFNRAKSDLKFLEASALGLPMVASSVEAYAGTIKHGQTGLLTTNDPVDWTTAIERLRGDPSLRQELASAALDYVSNERLLMHHATESEGLLDALLTGPAG